MIILGGGMSGCIAACMFPGSWIYEAGEKPNQHKAVLRFRSNAVSEVTGIPFKKVTVRKAIWDGEKEVQPTPRLANLYSRKVIGQYLDRSIWNIDPVERYIAPEDFHEQLLQRLEGEERILYGNRLERITDAGNLWFENTTHCFEKPIISTIPMNIMRKIAGYKGPTETQFKFESIKIFRGKVEGSDVYQTIYYPLAHCIYRATLTGEDLIIESKANSISDFGITFIAKSFGINLSDIKMINDDAPLVQQYGKIADIDDMQRKLFIAELTMRYNIFSLGRFAIWKNILLDDVVNDCIVIKKMIHNGQYSLLRQMT